jgi:hypothetical protein
MSVIPYWHERLRARQPFRLESLRIEGYNTKARNDGMVDTWPRAVAKQALRQDYVAWFEQEYLPQFTASGFYAECPEALPEPLDDLHFFTAIGPFLYLVGREAQTRSYRVREQKRFEGRWMPIRVMRNFVRLCEWHEHVAAFELATGMSCGARLPPPSRENMETVTQGVKVTIRKLAENRSALPPQMENRKG